MESLAHFGIATTSGSIRTDLRSHVCTDDVVAQIEAAFAVDANLAAKCVRSLLSQLQRIRARPCGLESNGHSRLAPWQMAKVKAVIDTQLHRAIHLDELAQCAGLSTSHFARAFRGSAGMPPYSYVLERRLDCAERMLSETCETLVNIALACGFSSQSSLTRAFTQRRGMSPGVWRSAATRSAASGAVLPS